jgi:hypothetical protein
LLALSICVVLGCSDDGLPAGGTDGADAGAGSVSASEGSGSVSGSSAQPSGSSGDESPGTSSDTAGTESGDSTTAGTVPSMACESDEDCVLVDDCCTCAAVHVDDVQPECPMDCEVSSCTANNIPDITVECRFGSCEFVPLDCNPLLVVCDQAPPECPDGQLPSVVDGCWGPCISTNACDVVGSCDDCRDDEACVQWATEVAPYFVCEPIDPSCEGAPDCTCMPGVCEDPFECAAPGGNGADLGCGCKVCG